MKTISKEKKEWMKEVGIKEFKRPMKYYLGSNWLFSEKYLKETPLEEIKAKVNFNLIEPGEPDEN